MNEPFLAFSKVIVNYIHNKYRADRYKANIGKLILYILYQESIVYLKIDTRN